ncbi:MAG: MBL fold metallo-hydrolase [Pseudonocardia sp.]|nr:MBL fold metallo-hydrolase [Pseudonocardia sp.]MBO0874381.1 MBL fold metallo-hydrolase [Pseudonocardia sp.]
MELTVLGCSGSGPGPDSPSSGYLVRVGERALTLDLGNGALGALHRYLEPFDLDALVLSHLHPDHCADVASLVVYRRYHPAPPYPAAGRRLPVYGPAETADRLGALCSASADERAGEDLSDVFEFRPLAPLTVGSPDEVAGVAMSACRAVHPCESYAVRLEHGGRSLAYSGDTGACDALVDLARGADVLLCEATWPHTSSRPPGVHLSGREAGEHAAAAGVGRLLLTHVQVWFDAAVLLAEAKSAFDGPVELVTAGTTYRV